MVIKEAYNKIDDWVSDKDSDKIEFILRSMNPSDSFFKMIFYHRNIYSSRYKNYILGDSILSINDISKLMINHIKSYLLHNHNRIGIKLGCDYDNDGYCTQIGIKKINYFFNTLNQDKLLSISKGSVMNDYEIDIDGGRLNIMAYSGISEYLFNYIYYTLKITHEDFRKKIYNDTDDVICVLDLYPPKLEFIDDFEGYYLKILEKYQRGKIIEYNRDVDTLINRFKDVPLLKEFTDKIGELKLSNSYVDAKIRELKINKVIN